MIPNSVAILSNCIDFVYYPFILKRTSYDVFLTNGLSKDFYRLLPDFFHDYWLIGLLWIALSISLLLYFKRFIHKHIIKEELKVKTILSKIAIIILLIPTIVLIGRGGLQLRPITVVSAANYTSPKYIPLLINTPFSIFTTYEQTSLQKLNYMSDEEAQRLIPTIHKSTSTSEQKLNVVILILESFSKEYIGYFNNNKGYTPFLDSLMNKSIVFNNAFANGKKSIEGIPAILAGIPTLMDIPYLNTNYATNEINSIASILKSKGYYSTFFHGGANGTMGFNQFCKLAQYDEYFGQDEYGNEKDYDGSWGVWDEPFLKRCADEMDRMTMPFHTAIFTLSSHHPFKIPEKYQEKFPDAKHPIFKSIRYADYALKEFFKKAEQKKWFKNTLFIITADHTNQAFSPYHQSRSGNYAIPFVIYRQGSNTHQEINKICQQIDIMPTLIKYLGLNTSYYSLGNNALDTLSSGYSINYLAGTHQLIKDNYSLLFNGEETIGFFDLKNDSMQINNLVVQKPGLKDTLQDFQKAFLQIYRRDLIKNKMTANRR